MLSSFLSRIDDEWVKINYRFYPALHRALVLGTQPHLSQHQSESCHWSQFEGLSAGMISPHSPLRITRIYVRVIPDPRLPLLLSLV
jgi:hypothetical protein